MSKSFSFAVGLLVLTATSFLLLGCKVEKRSDATKKSMIAKDDVPKTSPDGERAKGGSPVVHKREPEPIEPSPVVPVAPPTPESLLLTLAAQQAKHEIDSNNPKLDERARKEARANARQAEQQRQQIYQQVTKETPK